MALMGSTSSQLDWVSSLVGSCRARRSLLLRSSQCNSSNAPTFYLLICLNPTCWAISILAFFIGDNILRTLKNDSVSGTMNNISCLRNVRLALLNHLLFLLPEWNFLERLGKVFHWWWALKFVTSPWLFGKWPGSLSTTVTILKGICLSQ